jgi:hypothetical protein
VILFAHLSMKSYRITFSLLLALSLAACGKKEEEAPAAAAPVAAEAAPTEDASAVPAAAPAEAAPSKRDWNAVVAEIAKIKLQRPMTDEKRARALELQDELTSAAASDPAAREAYQNLARILNGR